jgi:hypothetical protein
VTPPPAILQHSHGSSAGLSMSKRTTASRVGLRCLCTLRGSVGRPSQTRWKLSGWFWRLLCFGVLLYPPSNEMGSGHDNESPIGVLLTLLYIVFDGGFLLIPASSSQTSTRSRLHFLILLSRAAFSPLLVKSLHSRDYIKRSLPTPLLSPPYQ